MSRPAAGRARPYSAIRALYRSQVAAGAYLTGRRPAAPPRPAPAAPPEPEPAPPEPPAPPAARVLGGPIVPRRRPPRPSALRRREPLKKLDPAVAILAAQQIDDSADAAARALAQADADALPDRGSRYRRLDRPKPPRPAPHSPEQQAAVRERHRAEHLRGIAEARRAREAARRLAEEDDAARLEFGYSYRDWWDG